MDADSGRRIPCSARATLESLYVSTPLRPFVRVSALVLACALALPAPVAARTVLEATSLGMSDEISFRDRTDEVPFPIPVPTGLTPQTLTGTVQIPVDLESGFLEAWSGDLLLARVSLDGAVDFMPVEIPLDRARVRDDVADVTLRTVLTSSGLACPDWSERSLGLRDAEVTFDGEPEVPEVLADFIPPVLERLEIYVPDEPTRAETQAATELAVASAARFGARGLEVVVLPVDGPRSGKASPFTRRVELNEGSETGISIVDTSVPTAQISGDAATLAHQARSVSSGLRDLAVADAVTVDATLPTPRALITEATLDDLAIGSVSSRGIGTATASFGIDQTRLGTVAGEVTVELAGTYSPPPGEQSGLIVVSAGDMVLDSWVADGSGVIDRTVVVPAQVLGRYTEVSVVLQTAGVGAACGVVQPLSVLISGASLLQIDESSSPAPHGFDSLPQALMPRLDVATGSGSLDEIRRAIRIVTELQTLSSSLLRPEWVSVEDLVSGGAPGVLVTSHSTPEELVLPLELTGGRTLEVMGEEEAEPSTLRFLEDVDFASIQVVEDEDRAIVAASSTSGSGELDRTLDWLAADPDRWGELRGNVLFTAPGREPIQLSTTEATGASVRDQDTGSGGVRTVLIIGSVVVVAGLALAGVAWLATGRGRAGRRP